MKSQAECYQALLDAEKLQYSGYGKVVLHIDEKGRTVDDTGRELIYGFNKPRDWSVYCEPVWHDNIPSGGVLCYVGDYENKIMDMQEFSCPDANGYGRIYP